MTPINQQDSLTMLGCPDEITVISAPGVNQLPVNWEDPVAFDMQGNFAGKEGFPSPGKSFLVGTTQVFSTYFGNTHQLDCNFNVTVKPGNITAIYTFLVKKKFEKKCKGMWCPFIEL